jgi:zinc protease
MMSGTKHVASGEYEATLDRVGASDRGTRTALDSTEEWLTVPADAVDTVLWLWSDQMGFFAPSDPKALADARAAEARERATRVDAVALGALNGIVLRALFPDDHPYHLAPLEGSADDATLADVRAFHDEHLAPGRAVLTLVGDFATSAVLERVRAYFGPIAAAPPPPPAPKLVRAQLAADVRLDVVASVKAPEVWLDWRTPAFFDAGDAELDVFAGGIAGSRTDALSWLLVEQQRIATRVFARQISHALGSDFRVGVTVAPGHTPDEVVGALDTVLRNAATRGFTEIAFRGARSRVTVPYVHGLDRADRRATVYTELATAHRDPGSFVADVGRYDALTFDDVRAAATQWLFHQHHVLTVVTPDASAPLAGALRAAGGGAK